MLMHLGVPSILSPTYINPLDLPTQTHNEVELIIIIIIIARQFTGNRFSFVPKRKRNNKQMGPSTTGSHCFVCNETWCT